MGLRHRLREQLASADLALAHDGLRAVRAERRRAPLRERAAALRQRRIAVHPARAAHAKILAGGLHRRAVRVASAARRVRRVGGRAQGRVEHIFRAAVAAVLRKICGIVVGQKSKSKNPVRPVLFISCARPAGQADARHVAVHHAAPGLVAAQPRAECQFQNPRLAAVGGGKNPALPADDFFLRRHLPRASEQISRRRGGRFAERHSARPAAGQCAAGRHGLSRPFFLAGEPRHLLSVAENFPDPSHRRRRAGFARHHHRRVALAARASVFFNRLAVVSRHARAGQRPRPSRRCKLRRPLHLPAAGGNFHHRHFCRRTARGAF